MPKDRDKALNPAAAQRKAEKAKAIKKGKAAVAAQRTDRLAARNPARLQRQIDELREAAKDAGGTLPDREQKSLEELERELARIRRAKEAVGDKSGDRHGNRDRDRDGARERTSHGARDREGHGYPDRGRGVLGKRARQHSDERHSSSSDTDPEVRSIPMPSDTPPPIPRRHRPRHGHRHEHGHGHGHGHGAGDASQQANATGPNGEQIRDRGRIPNAENQSNDISNDAAHTATSNPAAQTVYEAAPSLRNLQREAVGLVPSAVRRKLEAHKGVGGRLLEEDEADALEREGYGQVQSKDEDYAESKDSRAVPEERRMEGQSQDNQDKGQDEDDQDEEDVLARLEEEQRRFQAENRHAESRHVQIEEVEDEDA